MSGQMQRVFAALGVDSFIGVARALSTESDRVSEGTVRGWSLRNRVPPWWLRTIADKSGCHYRWLATGEGPQRPKTREEIEAEIVETEVAASTYDPTAILEGMERQEAEWDQLLRDGASKVATYRSEPAAETPQDAGERRLLHNYRLLDEPAQHTLLRTSELFLEESVLRRASNERKSGTHD